MKTLHELVCTYIEENPRNLSQSLIINKMGYLRMQHGGVWDMSYDEVSAAMLDAEISKAKTDLTKTILAFLFRELDLEANVVHQLAIYQEKNIWEL